MKNQGAMHPSMPNKKTTDQARKGIPVLVPFLAVVSAIFIGILIWAYVETRKANPQMLDEHGRIEHSS